MRRTQNEGDFADDMTMQLFPEGIAGLLRPFAEHHLLVRVVNGRQKLSDETCVE